MPGKDRPHRSPRKWSARRATDCGRDPTERNARRGDPYRGGGGAAGGVSTSGGFGFGRATTGLPGAGRISIGGGSGATCWLTTGAFGAGFGFGAAAAAAGGRGT